MSRAIIFFICLFIGTQILIGKDLAFQLYLYDSENKQSLNSETELRVTASILINDVATKNIAQNQRVNNGILNISFQLNNDNDIYLLDNKDVYLKLIIENDEIPPIPILTAPLSLVTDLADRTLQFFDSSVLNVDYVNNSIGINTIITGNELVVSGAIKASSFEGDGENILNVVGSGLNDDHSLEKNGSRTCSDLVAKTNPNCQTGDDVLFVSSEAYVGVNTKTPEVPLHIKGSVLFTSSEKGIKGVEFPIKKNRNLFIWDHESAALKIGYISQSESVRNDAFLNSSVAIGNNHIMSGDHSVIIGGDNNKTASDYSAIIGGQNNNINGDYSVSIGGDNQGIQKGYVTVIGGSNNYINSNYSILISAKNNSLNGLYNTIIGDNNLVKGNNNVVLSGSNNVINSNQSILFGNSSDIKHDRSWVINVSDQLLAKTFDSNQVIWFADQGISFNTTNITEALNVGGKVKANYFYGDGSQLTNVSFVDPYWEFNGTVMFNNEYQILLNTDKNQNRVSLSNGMIISDDGSTRPGTLSYKNNTLYGYTSTGKKNLIIDGKQTQYQFSTEFNVSGDSENMNVSLMNGNPLDYFVFNGDEWVVTSKNGWVEIGEKLMYHRPVSIGGSSFYGMLNLNKAGNNQMVFSNINNTKGLSINNIPSTIGFNLKQVDGVFQKFDPSKLGYKISFNTNQGGVLILNETNENLLGLSKSQKIDFFDTIDNETVNISKPSKISSILVDSNENSNSQLSLVGHLPFLINFQDGRLHIQSDKSQPIDFHNQLKITDQGEFLLSQNDNYALGTSNLTIGEGDIMLDNGRSIGVFNSSQIMQQGIQVNNESFVFIPDLSGNYSTFINEQGLGIRTESDSALTVSDTNNSTVFIEKGSKSSQVVFRKNNKDLWFLKSDSDTNNKLKFVNDVDQTILLLSSSQININSPEFANKDININGNINIDGDINIKLTKLDNSASSVFKLLDTSFIIQSLTNADGTILSVNGNDGLFLSEAINGGGSVGINGKNANYNLYVNQPTYISNFLYYNNEVVKSKTIKDNSTSYVYKDINTLSFNDGYTISQPMENKVAVTLNPNFNKILLISMDNITQQEQIDNVVPNGIDQIKFDGEMVSIIPSNVEGFGIESSLDTLTFINDLIYGGDIVGTFSISQKLSADYIKGDISKMDDINFPWQHRIRDNDGVTQNFEYVMNKKIGIGTNDPDNVLSVNGTALLNTLISPSVNMTGQTFTVNESDLVVDSIGTTTVNVLGTLKINKLEFSADGSRAGLNNIDTNYKLTIFKLNDPDIKISSRGESIISFFDGDEKGRVLVNNDSVNPSFVFGGQDVGVNTLISVSPNSKLVVTNNGLGIGIGLEQGFQSALAVSGNLVIGSGFTSTSISGVTNSVIVKEKVGVGTNNPIKHLDIYGSSMIAEQAIDSITDDNSLIIDSQLLINQSGAETVIVKKDTDNRLEGIGVNGRLIKKIDGATQLNLIPTENNEVIIGYNAGNSNYQLKINAENQIQLNPTANTIGLRINNNNVGLGTNSPIENFHIFNSNNEIKIESTSVQATLGFGSKGSLYLHQTRNFVISNTDGQPLNNIGIEIDTSGNVDIGYDQNIRPTHDAALDVLYDVNANQILLNNKIISGMPIGSIIMWSGWSSQLPDGWRICMGIDASNDSIETDKCDFRDLFIVGRDNSSDANFSRINAAADIQVAPHNHHSVEYKIANNHAAHSHGNLASATHSHSNNINYTKSKNTDYYSKNFTSGTMGEVGGTAVTVYSSSSNHRHSVSLNHSHTASGSSTHSHTVQNPTSGWNHTSNSVHSNNHTVDLNPLYYKLVFLYLEGEE